MQVCVENIKAPSLIFKQRVVYATKSIENETKEITDNF